MNLNENVITELWKQYKREVIPYFKNKGKPGFEAWLIHHADNEHEEVTIPANRTISCKPETLAW